MTPTLRRIGQENCLPVACALTAAGDPRAQDGTVAVPTVCAKLQWANSNFFGNSDIH